MENTKIGSKEAIALLTTISFNQLIVGGIKIVINNSSSSSLLNLLYLSILIIIFTCIMCYFFNKFPTFDLIDISNFLGKNFLKWGIGILYVLYFSLWIGNLLYMFSSCLHIIYFPQTLLFFIKLFIIFSATISCLFKNNAVYKSTFIIFPLLLISTLFLFASDAKFFNVENIYPMFGKGIFSTFVIGLNNIVIFQSLAYILFFPTLIKKTEEIKKIAVHSIIISAILNIVCVATVLFTFNSFVEVDELMPLYSAVRLIDYGSFFKKLDSIFFLIWIICFISYISITIKISANILKKLTYLKSDSVFVFLCAILIFVASSWQKNYAVSICFLENVLKYVFFVLIFVITPIVLVSALIKKKLRGEKFE